MLRLAFTFLALGPWCCVATTAATPAAWQFSTHNIDPGNGAQNKLVVADSAGNLFVVSTLSPQGRASPVHVTKTDSTGNVLSVFDFGGSGITIPVAATVDGNGNLLIGGTTSSADFPLVSPLQTTGLAFLARLDNGLTRIVYSTLLGTPQNGTQSSSVNAIALDTTGNIYVTGNTGAGLPVSTNAFQSRVPDGSTSEAYGFVAELSPDGSQQLFSTYYTGNLHIPPAFPCTFACPVTPPLETLPNAIAVDAEGNVIIAGTTSDAIPVTSGSFAQQCNCGTGGALDGFVAKLGPGGTALEWGTYLPLSDASAYDRGSWVSVQAIALDASGNVVLAGYAPTSFPTTTGALQASFPAAPPPADGILISAEAGFVAILDSRGSTLLHSSYFGGSVIGGAVLNYLPYSGVAGLEIDGAGTIWITGASSTVALPPGPEPVLGQNYIAALSPDLSALSTLYTVPDGGAGVAIALGPEGGIASVGSGAALLTGQPGTGPSVMGVAPNAAYSVSDLTTPYELISIYGLGIGPSTGLQGQIPGGFVRSLGGAQVLFDGAPAALLYAGPNQINAIVPANTGTTAPNTAMQIVTLSGTLAGPSLSVQQLLPGVFTDRGGFASPGLNQDGTVNSASNPAPLGSTVAVLVTGIGSPTGFDDTINFEESSNLAVAVLGQGPSCNGGFRSVEVTYAGSAANQPSGVSQVNFVLPDQKCNGLDYMSFEEFFSQYSETPVASGFFNLYVK